MELNEFLENRIKNMSVVREESYRKWIMNFLKENDIDGFCDDSYFSDELPEKDYENVRLLSFFYDYVEQLAFEQNILPEIDEFGEFEYIFCIDNTLFSICTIIGQGAFTSIKKVTDKELFVRFDSIGDFENEFVLPIFISSSLNTLEVSSLVSDIVLDIYLDNEKDVKIKMWNKKRLKEIIILDEKELNKKYKYSIKKGEKVVIASNGILRRKEI